MIVSIDGGRAPELTLGETDLIRSVRQNVYIILNTRRGEVPYEREFGISWDALDRPMTAAKALLSVEIKEAVERWEPRAQVVGVRFTESEEGQLIPHVEVDIK